MHRLLRGVDGQMRILCELDCGVIESGGEHKEPLANQLPRGAMVVTVLASSGWGGGGKEHRKCKGCRGHRELVR